MGFKNHNHIGMHKSEIETPVLMIDLDLMEHNLLKMAGYFATVKSNLRPHAKTHKTPALARKQIDAGAIGICCGNLSEAEVMIAARISDVLVTREIVLPVQIARAAELSRHSDIMVVVDSEGIVDRFSQAATAAGVQIRVLVDVDVGLGRSGVLPGEGAASLSRRVHESEGLRYMGLMGYEGAMHDLGACEREQRCRQAMQQLIETRRLIERNGIQVPIVSAAGTTTYKIASTYPEITEIQAGSYLTYDAEYARIFPEFECALSVLTTVISRPSSRRVTTDAGKKKLTEDAGLPRLREPNGIELIALAEEHGIMEITAPDKEINVGHKLEIIPSHGCTTFNLYDQVYGFRDGRLEVIWDVAARGT